MKHCLSICIFVLTTVFTAQAQEQTDQPDQHFRYYTLQIKNLNSEESEEIARAFEQSEAIQLDMFCEETHQVLVKVSANYLKRIDDTKKEIRDMTTSVIPSRRIESIEVISIKDKSTICK